MAKARIFLGSSGAAKSQAKEFVKTFSSPTVEFFAWWEHITPGNTLLDDLDRIATEVDGAILLFSPEAEATIRGNLTWVPNLNVLFEFGFFYGRFPKNRVAMLKFGSFYLPSDLGGYIHIFGSSGFKRSAVSKISKRTKDEFGKWIAHF